MVDTRFLIVERLHGLQYGFGATYVRVAGISAAINATQKNRRLSCASTDRARFVQQIFGDDYQLAFFTPGKFPSKAFIRKGYCSRADQRQSCRSACGSRCAEAGDLFGQHLPLPS